LSIKRANKEEKIWGGNERLKKGREKKYRRGVGAAKQGDGLLIG